MVVEMIKMSSKGQIVIPQDIRTEIRASEGTIFAVVAGKDSVILKKIQLPSKKDLIEDLKKIAKEGKKKLERKGIKETDISSIIEKARAR